MSVFYRLPIRLLVLSIMVFTLASCGYFGDDPIEEEIVDARNRVGTCEFNIDELKQILVKEITEEINCLEQNIGSYRQFVRRESNDFVKRSELKEFVIDYFGEESEVLTNSIDLVFAFNELLLKDDKDKIRVKNIKPLFNILRISNTSLAKLNSTIDLYDSNRLNFIDAGIAVKDQIQELTQTLEKIMKAEGVTSDARLDIMKFITDIQNSYGILNLDRRTITAILSVKKLMLGGEATFLTRLELFDALKKLPDLGKVFFSVLKGERADNIGNDYALRLRESIDTLEDQFFQHRPQENMINNDVLNDLIKFFAKEEDVKLYTDLLTLFRKKMLNEGLETSYLSFKDVNNIFTFAKVFLDFSSFTRKYQEVIEDKDDWDERTWVIRRRKFVFDVKFLEKELIEAVSNNKYMPNQFFYSDFLEGIGKEIDSIKLDEHLIDLIEGAKILFLGGKQKTLVMSEVNTLLNKLDYFAARGFDILFASKRTHNSDRLLDLYFKTVEDLEKELFSHRRGRTIIKSSSLDHVLGFFVSEDKLTPYKEIVASFRKYLLNEGRERNTIDFREIKNAFTYFRTFLDVSGFYNNYKKIIEDKSAWDAKEWSAKLEEFNAEVAIIHEHLVNSFSSNSFLPERFLLVDFANSLDGKIDNVNIDGDILKIVSDFKVLFFGGRSTFISKNELVSFVDKIPVLADSFFRVAFANDKNQPEGELDNIYFTVLDQLEKEIFPHRFERIIIKEEIIDKILGLAFKDEELEKYKKVVHDFRLYILNEGQPTDGLDYKDIRNTITVARGYLKLSGFYNEFIELFKDSSEWDAKVWDAKRKLFTSQVQEVRKELDELLTYSGTIPRRIFWMDFLLVLENDFLGENTIISDNKALIEMAKVLIVGGEKEIISNGEFIDFAEKIPDLTSSLFDLALSSEKTHNKKAIRKLQYSALGQLRSSLAKTSFTSVASVSEVLDVAAKFLKDDKIRTLEPSVIAVGSRMIGLRDDMITIDNVRRVLDYLYEFAGITYFMDISADLYSGPMSFGENLTRLIPKQDAAFNIFTKNQFKKYDKLFRDILFNYRIYGNNENGIQVYDKVHRRSKEGLVELAILKYGLQEFMPLYGRLSPINGKYVMNIEQINLAMQELKSVLVYVGMWSSSPDTFARNVMLLSDLFQGQSNGSVDVDYDEGAEFAALVFTSSRISGKFAPILDKYCSEYSSGDLTGYRTSCFRKYFYTILMNKLKMGKYLMKFNSYYRSANPTELNQLLIAVEGFARDSKPDQPLSKREITLIVGAFLNIESIFARYDLGWTRADNVLSNAELKNAFPVYKKALMDIGNISEDNEKYALPAFMFIIGKGKIPSQSEVFFFYNNPFSSGVNDVTAKRLNIGQLLNNMVQAANAQAN